MLSQYDRLKIKLFATLFGQTTVKDGSFIRESIVEGQMPSGLLQQILADLRAKRHLAHSAPERIAIDGAIADVLDGIFASGGSLPVHAASQAIDPAAAVHQVIAAERPMSELSPFYGMGLKEACPKLLRLIGEKRGKIAQTAREIWDQLKAEGWTSNHNNPAHSVNDALRRRAKTHRDVMLVGAGKWGLVDWYDEAELEEIRKSMGGMGGRDKGDHIERTKAGMATAKMRGAQLGASKKLTEEQGKQLLELARAGLTKEKIAKQFDISPASVSNYVKRLGYDSWREVKREGKKLRATAADDPATETTEPGGTRH